MLGSMAAKRWPSHQLPIRRMATEAASTQRLREENRGLRIEDRESSTPDTAVAVGSSVLARDPRSSILDRAKERGQGCGISDWKNKLSNSSTAEFGFRISVFVTSLFMRHLQFPGPSSARPGAGGPGSSACARP